MSGPAYCLVRGVIHFNHKDCRNWCAVWNVQCRLYLMDCKCSKWVWMCLQHVGDERTFFWISLFKILNSMGIYMQHSGPKQHRVITWRIHGHRALLCGIDSPAWSVCSLVFCEKAVFFFFFFMLSRKSKCFAAKNTQTYIHTYQQVVSVPCRFAFSVCGCVLSDRTRTTQEINWL